MTIVGGFVAKQHRAPLPVPVFAALHDELPVWSMSDGPMPPARIARSRWRAVCVLGTCGADEHAVDTMATRGVRPPDLTRWPGAYSLIEITSTGVTVHADLAAAVPIYWTAISSGLAWSTSARALAGLTGAGVDPTWLAVRILTPASPDALATRSAFIDIHRVPAHHRVVLTPIGTTTPVPLWNTEPTATRAEAASRLGDALTASVALRVLETDGRPTSDLSGGFDSVTLTRIGARTLAERGRTIGAITLHHKAATIGGDLDYVPAAANHPAIRHHMLALDDSHQPYTDVATVLPATDEAAPATVGHVHFSHQLNAARDVFGSTAHLTGDGGDTLLCPPLVYLADLLRAGCRRTAMRHALGWAHLHCTSPREVLRQAREAARTSRSLAMRRVADTLTGDTNGPGGIALLPVENPPPWTTPHARHLAAGAYLDAERATRHEPSITDLGNEVTWRQIGEIGRTAAADAHLARALTGVRLHNPFVDSAVVAAALACPSRDRTRPDAYKPLLLQALPGLLPPSISARKTKGQSTGDHLRGLRTHLTQVLDLVDGRLVELDLVDVHTLRTAIRHSAAGIGSDAVESVIASEMWLRAHHAARALTWHHRPAPAPAPRETA
ncbi:albusnodin/ikarugamycin family macrolactam cyclase [Embleya sp. NPDC056575]|uniref:albusnodin/ikarugamycin family macrolactam cyclase n=1 Tax=unclassified Embleya TaxID=2699296 RepID=UPI0036CD765E